MHYLTVTNDYTNHQEVKIDSFDLMNWIDGWMKESLSDGNQTNRRIVNKTNELKIDLIS